MCLVLTLTINPCSIIVCKFLSCLYFFLTSHCIFLLESIHQCCSSSKKWLSNYCYVWSLLITNTSAAVNVTYIAAITSKSVQPPYGFYARPFQPTTQYDDMGRQRWISFNTGHCGANVSKLHASFWLPSTEQGIKGCWVIARLQLL